MNAHMTVSGVPIDGAAIAEAEALGVDVAAACEAGLRAETRRVADARWVEENLPAMEAWNAWVEEHGLPLARYRMF